MGSRGLVIPQSFLGVSHEWPFVEDLAYEESYIKLFKKLQSYGAGAPVLRVGGGSTDKLNIVPPSAVYSALTTLHRRTGMLFIIGLNFELGDVALARAQMVAAASQLPPRSIISFEIGNEVRQCGGHY